MYLLFNSAWIIWYESSLVTQNVYVYVCVVDIGRNFFVFFLIIVAEFVIAFGTPPSLGPAKRFWLNFNYASFFKGSRYQGMGWFREQEGDDNMYSLFWPICFCLMTDLALEFNHEAISRAIAFSPFLLSNIDLPSSLSQSEVQSRQAYWILIQLACWEMGMNFGSHTKCGWSPPI